PTPVSPKRQQALSIRWILEAVRGRKGRPVGRSLSDELLAAYRREGNAMTKRENVNRMADANKAFAHFAW
ncbi:MAG: 30S ribosomal protein S7, partial [Fuerstiella sp.]